MQSTRCLPCCRLERANNLNSTSFCVCRRKQPWDLESRRDQSQSYIKTLRAAHHAPGSLAALPRPTSKQHVSWQRPQKPRGHHSELNQPAHQTANHRPCANGEAGLSGHVVEPCLGVLPRSPVVYDIPMPPSLRESWRFGGLTAYKDRPLRSHGDASEAVHSSTGDSCGDGWRLPDVPRLTPHAKQQQSPAWKAADTTRHERSFAGTTPFVRRHDSFRLQALIPFVCRYDSFRQLHQLRQLI